LDNLKLDKLKQFLEPVVCTKDPKHQSKPATGDEKNVVCDVCGSPMQKSGPAYVHYSGHGGRSPEGEVVVVDGVEHRVVSITGDLPHHGIALLHSCTAAKTADALEIVFPPGTTAVEMEAIYDALSELAVDADIKSGLRIDDVTSHALIDCEAEPKS
jgi:hypothetical protein